MYISLYNVYIYIYIYIYIHVCSGLDQAKTVCQKCLAVGHWTYECKSAASTYQAPAAGVVTAISTTGYYYYHVIIIHM